MHTCNNNTSYCACNARVREKIAKTKHNESGNLSDFIVVKYIAGLGKFI